MDHSAHHSKHHDHDKHAGHSVKMFKDKFWLSLALTIPVLLYSEMIQHWLNFSPPSFFGSTYIPFIFSTIIFFYGGLVFIKSAYKEIKSKKPGMMTLISLAIITAYVYSIATLFFIPGESFFWELSTLTTIMLLGHWLEMASIAKAQNALDSLSKLLPDTAERIKDGATTKVAVSQLNIGDFILVRPGSRVPVDGVITEGVSMVDESAITGESKPVHKQHGANVVAGTNNQDGALTIEVTKIGNDTALAGIMRLVAEAQTSKSNTQVLADKAAFYLTFIAIIVAIITFIFWTAAESLGIGLERAVTVLIIACPHALGLAIPLVVSISTAVSAKNGLLVRRRLALEAARNLDWVLFDKTGTLTKGTHEVVGVWAQSDLSTDKVLEITASLEQKSEHSIGKGIVKSAEAKGLNLDQPSSVRALPGLGIEGSIKGQKYSAVSTRYLEENSITVPQNFATAINEAAKNGATEVYLLNNGVVIGAIATADVIRDESKRAVQRLHDLGVKTAMITGDSKEVANYVAGQLGIDHYFAEVKPEDKAAKVKELQAGGQKVAMVGDGINDAPALTQATIGIAIGAGTDVAVQSADIILIKNNPEDILKIMNLSKATYKKMQQNLAWAVGYNVFAVPLAAGVLAGFGFVLAPAVGAVLMSLSTIIVAINAQLLRRVKLS